MKHYRVKNIIRQDGVVYLTIQAKRRRDVLDFMAGQYATIGFRGSNGRRSPMRCFSIVSSAAYPDELQFATRIGGNFTQSLANLQPGDEMFVQGPFGEFAVDERYDRNLVMVAGGIGITPIMSILRTAAHTGTRIPTTVLYSCRSGRVIPFHDELIELERGNPWLRVITFVTDKTTPPETPRLLSGRMTERHLHAVLGGNYSDSTYFVCGPKGFMDSTQAMLAANNVNDSRIITESFTQSSQLRFNNGYSIQKLTYVLTAGVLIAGVGFIAALDLSRYVPRHVSAATTSQITTTTPAASSTDTSSDGTSTTSNTPTDSGSSNTSSSSSTAPSTTQYQQTYQAPVTSVS